jgi:hypothetical protein
LLEDETRMRVTNNKDRTMATVGDPKSRCEWAPDDGVLRAIADGEVAHGWRTDIDAHVRNCDTCRNRSQALRATGAFSRGRLLTIAPAEDLLITPPSFDALQRATSVSLHVRALTAITSARTARWSWGLKFGACAAAIALATVSPGVSSFADGALQSFRVQRVQPIAVDADVLRGRLSVLPIDEAKVREALGYRGPDKPTITITSQSDAAARAGMVLRLPRTVPTAFGSKPARFVVASGGTATMTVDGPRLTEIAKEAKVSDAALLTRIGALNGASIKVEGSPAVVAVWGDVDIPTQVPDGKSVATMSTPTARGPVMMFGQMKSPIVNVPASVDVGGLRDALISSGAVPPEVVQALGAIKEWRTTLPVPTGTLSGSRQVELDGSTATVSTRMHNDRPITSVVWVRDGVIYGAVGDLTEAEILGAARSVVTAKS